MGRSTVSLWYRRYFLQSVSSSHFTSGDIRIGIEYSSAGLLAGNGFILQERAVGLLFQGSIEGTYGYDEPRSFLEVHEPGLC